MKDIVFTPKQQKREILLLCYCMLTAFVLNIIAIIVYKTDWSELWTQLLWVLFIGVLLYGLSIVVRLIYYGIKSVFKH